MGYLKKIVKEKIGKKFPVYFIENGRCITYLHDERILKKIEVRGGGGAGKRKGVWGHHKAPSS